MSWRRWFAPAAALLAGCGYVAVYHVVPPANLPANQLSRLARLAIVMELEPPEVPSGLLGTAVKTLTRPADSDAETWIGLPRAEAQTLMNNVAAALSAPGTGMVGYFVDGPGTPALLNGLQATAALWIRPSRIKGTQKQAEDRTVDKNTHKEIVTRYAVQQMECSFTYRLEAWPERSPLASRTLGANIGTRTNEPVALREWLHAQAAPRANWLAALQRDLLPARVRRDRKLKKNPSPAVKAGYDAALNGRWDEAGAQWSAEADRNPSLEVLWDLGIWNEHAGRFAEARASYEHVRGLAAKSGDRATLDQWMREMDAMFQGGGAGPAPATGPGWFDGPVAVIPFGNTTNNVAAADRVRAAAFQGMARRGYALVPLPDVDARMHAMGLSQGDQLAAFDPAKVVQAAGASRVLVGTVVQFKTVNVGLYQSHVVVVQYRLIDAAGHDAWTAPGYGVHEIVVRPQDGGKAFLGGLIGTTLDKVTNQYLEEEINEAVLTGLESLPAKPH